MLLLNISPRASGEIPADQQNVLLEIGTWLKQNGEAIYDTRTWYTYGEGPTKEPEGNINNRKLFDALQYTSEDYRFTKKGNTIYILSMGKPIVSSTILVNAFAVTKMSNGKKVKRVSMLGSNKKVDWAMETIGLKLSVPEVPNEISVVYKVEME